MTEQIVAIGDVHGCVKTLKALWEKLEPYEDYIHLFVGDYIDRGPDSKGVIDFLMDVRRKRKTIFLRGNHELMILMCDHPRMKYILDSITGVEWFFMLSKDERKGVQKLIESMPYQIEIETENGLVGITHASYPVSEERWQDITLSEDFNELADKCLWHSNHMELLDPVEGVGRIFHGHINGKEFITVENRIWIDSFFKNQKFDLVKL
jgi:hypothetical protein